MSQPITPRIAPKITKRIQKTVRERQPIGRSMSTASFSRSLAIQTLPYADFRHAQPQPFLTQHTAKRMPMQAFPAPWRLKSRLKEPAGAAKSACADSPPPGAGGMRLNPRRQVLWRPLAARRRGFNRQPTLIPADDA